MSPAALFRQVAVVEAITWSGLLIGMFLKYVTETTDQVVSIFGMLHGVAFIGYCLVTLGVAVDQRWRASRILLGLGAAIPPLATLWFERHVARRALLGDRWRLLESDPESAPDRVVALFVRRPVGGMFVGIVGIALLTALALALGPSS